VYPIQDIADLIPDSSRRTADIATGVIVRDQKLFDQMLTLALEEKGTLSMRAARVVSLASEDRPPLISKHIGLIVRSLKDIRHKGVKRGLLKTLLQGPFDYDEEAAGRLVHVCFLLFNDSSEEVAIRAYALDLLHLATDVYPELKAELIISIDTAMPQFSRAMKSRSRKIRNRLMMGS
jgi:hypothetical protein